MRRHQKTELHAIAEQKEITDRKAIEVRCVDKCKIRWNAANVSMYRHMHVESEEEALFINLEKV